MKVSRNSWHYRILMDEWQMKARNGASLCSYFWMVVFSIFAWCMIGVLGTAVFCVFLLVSYLTGYVWYFMIAGWFGVENFHVDAIEMSFIVNAFVVLAWIYSMSVRFNNKKGNSKVKQIFYDNLFAEYIKAKKQKVCPLIEVE